jgi:hypothetical protein
MGELGPRVMGGLGARAVAGPSGRTSGPPKGMLGPATHDLDVGAWEKSWVAGPSPAMTRKKAGDSPAMTRETGSAHSRHPAWIAAMPPERLRTLTRPRPASRIIPASLAWSGKVRMLSAR